MKPPEVIKKIAEATLELLNIEDATGENVVTPLRWIADRSGIPIGHVRSVLKERFKLQMMSGDSFVWTPDKRDAMEAYVAMPIDFDEQPAGGPVFHINGDHAQVAGRDMYVTVEQVVQRLEEHVEKSDLPPEQKKGALVLLGGFAKTIGTEALKAAVQGVTKGLMQ